MYPANSVPGCKNAAAGLHLTSDHSGVVTAVAAADTAAAAAVTAAAACHALGEDVPCRLMKEPSSSLAPHLRPK
jgi:hypothetical protein